MEKKNLQICDMAVTFCCLAGLETKRQEMVNRLNRAGSRLFIKADRTKTMVINGTTCDIRLQGNRLEKIDPFVLDLGSIGTEDNGNQYWVFRVFLNEFTTQS